jgi:hypothetical protein
MPPGLPSENAPDPRLSSGARESPALIPISPAFAPGVPNVKQSLKSRLFGIAVSLSAFAILVHPLVAKRW